MKMTSKHCVLLLIIAIGLISGGILTWILGPQTIFGNLKQVTPRFSTSSLAVTASDDGYFYLAGSAEVDIYENPEDLAYISQCTFPGNAMDIVVGESEQYTIAKFLFIATHLGLSIINITDPLNPDCVDSRDLGGSTGGVAAILVGYSGIIPQFEVYVTCGPKLFVITYLADGNPASIAASCDLPTIGRGVAARSGGGLFVFVTTSYSLNNETNSTLVVIDDSTIGAPTLIGRCNVSSDASDVAIQGDYAFVTSKVSLNVINIATPGSPTLIKNYSIANYASNIVLVNNIAYISSGQIWVIDVGFPSNPVHLGYLDLVSDGYPGMAGSLSVSGNHVLVTDSWNLKLFVIEVNFNIHLLPLALLILGIAFAGISAFASLILVRKKRHLVFEKMVVQKLEQMLKVSTRVKQEQMRKVLGLDEHYFTEKILGWATQFGFTIEGDDVIFSGGDVTGFIKSLDESYKEWQGHIESGSGKKDENTSPPSPSADTENKTTPLEVVSKSAVRTITSIPPAPQTANFQQLETQMMAFIEKGNAALSTSALGESLTNYQSAAEIASQISHPILAELMAKIQEIRAALHPQE